MATYCKDLNFIYFASPGTGSTSIEYAFLEQLETQFIKSDSVSFDYGNRHAQYLELKKFKREGLFLDNDILQNIDLDNVLKITSIRNPYDYFYADWFRNRTKWLCELEDLNSWVYQQPQKISQIVKACRMELSEWVIEQLEPMRDKGRVEHLNAQFTDFADLYIRMEHMQEDLQNISEFFELENPLVPLSLNRTDGRKERKNYWNYYNREARGVIADVFSPTLKKFNYVF